MFQSAALCGSGEEFHKNFNIRGLATTQAGHLAAMEFVALGSGPASDSDDSFALSTTLINIINMIEICTVVPFIHPTDRYSQRTDEFLLLQNLISK